MHEDSTNHMGTRLALVRKYNKLSQEKFGERIGVGVKHMSHVERGTASLSLKSVIKIGTDFGVNLDYFILGRKNDKALSLLPDTILDILYTGNEEEIDRLLRYLEIYVELHNKE